jgi:hypothetical protein
MTASPSLVLAASPLCWKRLRDESGARALAVAEDAALGQGGVAWLPLVDSDASGVVDRSESAWQTRLRSVAASPAAPLVLLWVARSRGEGPAFLRAIESLGDRMLRMLQKDRVPPRVAGVVYVAEQGIDESDAVALETMACAGRNLSLDGMALPRGLAEVLGPRGRAVFLMSDRTRVGPSGMSWPVAEVWPMEVARLLASLESSGQRQPGIRAWRSLRFNPTRYPFDRIEMEAFRFAREALGLPDSDGQRVEEGSGRQLPAARAPEGAVSTDRAPQHCLDRPSRGVERPAFPSWWDLSSESAESSAQERVETFGSRKGRRSRWYERFEERGAIFIDERRERSLESVDETIGPKAISYRSWHAIHGDAALPNWFASGQFYVGPDDRLDSPSQAIQGWSQLGAIERRVIELRNASLAEARELDVARAHFARLGWRFVCVIAASLFIATVFSSIFANAGWRWVTAMALASCGGAIVASAVVLWLEVRAGRRGRDAADRTVQHAEDAIAEGFLRRMLMGADGERSGRRRRWFQAAARTRDAARRLKAIVDIAEIHALRRAASDAAPLPRSLRAYVDATSVEDTDAALPVDSLREAIRRDPSHIVEYRRRQYQSWWSDSLRAEDPLQSGAIRHRLFAPAVTGAVVDLIDSFRRDLIGVVEREGVAADCRWSEGARVGNLLGPCGDLRNLGVQTQRAIGREVMRIVWVHAMIRRHAESATYDVRMHFGHGTIPQAVVSSIDRWGCMGLVIDEVAIGFRGGEAGVICIDHDSGVCVFEGLDRSGPVANAGAERP